MKQKLSVIWKFALITLAQKVLKSVISISQYFSILNIYLIFLEKVITAVKGSLKADIKEVLRSKVDFLYSTL